MAEEEDNQVSPQSNDKENKNATESPNDNTIEQVINQGIYGLTGLDGAVSKPDEEPSTNQKTQSTNPNENNTSDNNSPDSNNNDIITQNHTDSNSEGISANAAEDESDVNNQNQEQGELETLTNNLSALTNESQQNEVENEYEEEEEEEEEAEDQVDQDLPTSEVPDSENKIGQDNNEPNSDSSIQNAITEASDKLNQDNGNTQESNTNVPGELANLQADIGNSLLPNEITNNNPTNEITSPNENNENIDDNENAKDTNQNNENDNNTTESNENENAAVESNDENKNDDKNNDENDNSTDGMMVQDEFKDSYTNWKDSTTPKIPGTSSVTHLPPLETTPELDEMSKRMLERFESKRKLPDPEHYAQVLQYIQRQKVNSVVSNDFVSAGRYQTLSQKFMAAINSTHVNESQKKKLDLLEEKLEITNSKLRNFHSETDQLIKNERYKLTDKRTQLINIHQETLNNFEDHWNDEDFLIKYARPSSNLLQTKKIERSFVLVKDFEGAENCRKKVAELEKLESQQAQKRARSEMEKQYKKLTAKQDAEIDAFDDYARSQLELMSKDRSSQYETLIARQTKLQSQITEIKHPGRQSWTSASGPISLHSGSKGGTSLGTSLPSLSQGKNNQLENLMTPRTIQRYALFKTTMKQPKLTVKPLGAINQKRKQVQAPKF